MSKTDDFRSSLKAKNKKDISAASLFTTSPRQKNNDESDVKDNKNQDTNNNVNVSLNASIEDIANDKNNPSSVASVNVNLAAIPVAESKQGILETHKQKNFYIRKDLAALIEDDIKKRRGAMTEIVNALFEQYYRSQGRIK